MMSALVGRSKLTRKSPSNSRGSCPPAAGAAGAAAAGVAPRRVRVLPPPPTATPVMAVSVCPSSSQLAFSQ